MILIGFLLGSVAFVTGFCASLVANRAALRKIARDLADLLQAVQTLACDIEEMNKEK